MANNIIKRVWNQGSMTPIEDLQGSAFTNENGGHTFQISGVDSNGEALALSGTVAASFLRPDQTTVGISGSVSGGMASVTLSEECYGIPGRFGLVVFLTSDGKKTAIYSCVGNVARSSTDAVAPGVTADVVDLINEIETAVGTIPASYSALMADIAPTYSSSALYAVGDYAWYDGDLKRCIVPITVGETYTPAHWTSAVVGDDVCALKSAISDSASAISNTWDLLEIESDNSGLQFSLGRLDAYGLPMDDNKFARTNYFTVKRGDSIVIPAGIKGRVYYYTRASGDGYSRRTEFLTGTYVLDSDAYVRMFVGYDDERTLSDTSIFNSVSIHRIADVFPVETNVIDLTLFEQGTIATSDGSNTQNDNMARIRSKRDVTLSGVLNFTVPNGYIIVNIYRYNISTGTYISYSTVDKRALHYETESNEKVRIVIAKADKTSSISPSDVNASDLLNTLVDSIETIKENALNQQNNIFNILKLESGTIDTTGYPKVDTKRLRTADYIYKSCYIGCLPGLVIRRVIYYNTSGTYQRYVDIDARNATIQVSNTEKIKVIFKRESGDADLSVLDAKPTTRLEQIEQHIGEVDELAKKVNLFSSLVLEQGTFDTSGGRIDSGEYYLKRVRTVDYILDNGFIQCPSGFIVTRVVFYNKETNVFSSYVDPQASSYNLTVPDGKKAKIVFGKTNTNTAVTVPELHPAQTLENYGKRLTNLEEKDLAIVEFTFDHEMYDLEEHGFPSYSGGTTSMSVVYGLFDALMQENPTYISKADAAEEVDLTYPDYAATYKTYVYKLIDRNNNVNTYRVPKKKLLLVAGTHGDETISIYNTYVLARRLCNDYLGDENLFKLRASWDIYIIPCLNGSGILEGHAWNHNGVNINKNYPLPTFSVSGTPGSYDYTGPYAGSEFETQLVMAYTNLISPDVAIDHHNYDQNLAWQFYAAVSNDVQCRIVYRSMADCAYTFKKNMPQYFGNGFGYNIDRFGGAPGYTDGIASFSTRAWWYYVGIPFSATLEVSQCINYLNGVYNSSGSDAFGYDTFSVNEYTLRTQVLRYCQYVMDNYK